MRDRREESSQPIVTSAGLTAQSNRFESLGDVIVEYCWWWHDAVVHVRLGVVLHSALRSRGQGGRGGHGGPAQHQRVAEGGGLRLHARAVLSASAGAAFGGGGHPRARQVGRHALVTVLELAAVARGEGVQELVEGLLPNLRGRGRG